jgi:DNA replication protein DnaC
MVISSSDEISKGKEEKCPICGGSGWIRLDLPLGHPDFGKAFPCKCKTKKFEQESVNRLKRYSNLGHLARFTFENLNPDGRSDDSRNKEQFRRCYEVAKSYAQNPERWIVITGPSGCGKTHLTAAIVNFRINQGFPALFMVVPDLLDHLRTTFNPKSEITYDELFERVRNAPFLVLDDLGSQSSTDWAEEKLFQVLNYRFNTQLPTVVTTIALGHLNERLRTRFKDTALVQELELEKKYPPFLQEIGGISRKFLLERSFEHFDTRGKRANESQRRFLRVALDAAQKFAESPEKWLVFTGPHGSGKTHLAAAIANRCLELRRAVFFVVVPDFLDHLRSTFSPDSRVTYDEIFEGIKKSPLLILDDLGAQSGTSWVEEKLFQILNYRYNTQLPTVITTNCYLEEIGERLSSRMTDPHISSIFPLPVPSYRALGT